MSEESESSQGERSLLGYLVRKWRGGKVIGEKQFPPTAKGRRAAMRLKQSFKATRPGRGLGLQAQDCNVIPIYGFCPEEAEVTQ